MHSDSVHRHFNLCDEKALTLAVKGMCTWMITGLGEQGCNGSVENEERFGPREERGRIRTRGVLNRKDVISPSDTVWENTPLGPVRAMAPPEKTDGRTFSVDLVGHLPVLARTAARRDVRLESVDGVLGCARVAKEPKRYEITEGDTLYVPQNHICQPFAADGTPLRVFPAQNRVFQHLGYDNVHNFGAAPEYASDRALADATT